MKKLLAFFGAMIFASAILTSCGGSSIESYAKKVAELECKGQKLAQKATSGDASVAEEMTKMESEHAALLKEVEGKYPSDSDKKKFMELLKKELENCK